MHKMPPNPLERSWLANALSYVLYSHICMYLLMCDLPDNMWLTLLPPPLGGAGEMANPHNSSEGGGLWWKDVCRHGVWSYVPTAWGLWVDG